MEERGSVSAKSNIKGTCDMSPRFDYHERPQFKNLHSTSDSTVTFKVGTLQIQSTGTSILYINIATYIIRHTSDIQISSGALLLQAEIIGLLDMRVPTLGT